MKKKEQLDQKSFENWLNTLRQTELGQTILRNISTRDERINLFKRCVQKPYK
jgi:hypothetical protein